MGSDTKLNGRIAVALGLLLFSIYLFDFGGTISSWDGDFAFATTENLVQHAEFSASQMWWNGVRQQVGTLYAEPQSKYGLGTALVGVPLFWLALQIPGVSLVHMTLLSTVIISAASGSLLFLILRSLGYSPNVSGVTTLACGLATTMVVYAKDYYSEPFVAFALLAATWGLLRYRREQTFGNAGLIGLSLSLAVLLKLTNLLILPIFFVYGFAGRPWILTKRAALAIGFPLLASFLAIAFYNWSRYGSVLVSGYPDWESFTGYIPDGVVGMLFTLRKGLIFYAPLCLVGFAGLMGFLKSHRRETFLVCGIFLFHLLVFSAWYDWQGGVNFGPRYLVPVLPFLMLPAADLIARSRLGRFAFATLLPLSMAVQAVGAGVSYRIAPYSFEKGTPPRLFTPLAHLILFDPQHIDLIWLHHQAEGIVVDLPSVAACVLLIVLSFVALEWPRRLMVTGGLIGAMAVSLFVLTRNYHDERVNVSPEFENLVAHLSVEAKPDDVVVVGNSELTDLFLHYYRGPAKWYSLIKEDQSVPEDETWLFNRLVQTGSSIWFVTDTPAVTRPQRRPFEAWFAQHAFPIAQREFGPTARLLEYDTGHSEGPAIAAQPARLQFDHAVALDSFDVNPIHRVAAGDTVAIALHWQALRALKEDLTVFVQALDASNNVVWQVDRFPANGFRPTSSWTAGESIDDLYAWRIDSSVSPGHYRLIAGLYRGATGQRLAITTDNDQAVGDHTILGELDVHQ